MNIEQKITFTLTEDDVKSIVAEYLSEKGYSVSAKDVKLNVSNQWVGYGMDEHQVPCFESCTAVVKGE